ncbi:hypothetical protein GOODEAATRI_010778, partial [Goodea atripinnis]
VGADLSAAVRVQSKHRCSNSWLEILVREQKVNIYTLSTHCFTVNYITSFRGKKHHKQTETAECTHLQVQTFTEVNLSTTEKDKTLTRCKMLFLYGKSYVHVFLSD